MYYLHTTNKRSYTVGNMTIPALAPAGKKQEWLQLDEAGLQSLKSIKIMEGLIKRGEIAVYDKIPDDVLLNAHESNMELAALKERVTKLADENEVLRKDLEKADTAIKNGSSGNARALKELQEKYDELQGKYSTLQKEALAEINTLKSQLESKE